MTNARPALSRRLSFISVGYGEPVSSCEARGMFGCANGACVPEIKVNNSVNDCGDNSDEGKKFSNTDSESQGYVIVSGEAPPRTIYSVVFL